MTFAMPMAVFPALGERYGGANAAPGYLFAALSVGSPPAHDADERLGEARAAARPAAVLRLGGDLGRGDRRPRFRRQPGRRAAVARAPAGARPRHGEPRRVPDHDLERDNSQTELRGRLAGIEQLSYMSGPLLGNAEAGIAAAFVGLRGSIVAGGVICVVGAVALAGAAATLLGLRRAPRRGRGHPDLIEAV